MPHSRHLLRPLATVSSACSASPGDDDVHLRVRCIAQLDLISLVILAQRKRGGKSIRGKWGKRLRLVKGLFGAYSSMTIPLSHPDVGSNM